jgi:hypothetical protein
MSEPRCLQQQMQQQQQQQQQKCMNVDAAAVAAAVCTSAPAAAPMVHWLHRPGCLRQHQYDNSSMNLDACCGCHGSSVSRSGRHGRSPGGVLGSHSRVCLWSDLRHLAARQACVL